MVGKEKPWCYTTDPNKDWEFCDIPSCTTPEEATGEVIPPEVAKPPPPVDPGRSVRLFGWPSF